MPLQNANAVKTVSVNIAKPAKANATVKPQTKAASAVRTAIANIAKPARANATVKAGAKAASAWVAVKAVSAARTVSVNTAEAWQDRAL